MEEEFLTYSNQPGRVPLQAAGLLPAGFFGGMPHTILVIMVQSLLPKQQAMASGLAPGFMFFSGAVGSYFVGLIADRIGLALTLQGLALLPLIAISIAVWLPVRRKNQCRATACDCRTGEINRQE